MDFSMTWYLMVNSLKMAVIKLSLSCNYGF